MHPPSQFGPYRVVGALGEGGMGTVVRAVHVDTGLEVAIKTVRARAPSALRALDRELATLRRLAHPGVVRIEDAGHEEGIPWIALGLVDGEPLRAHLARWSTPSGPAAATLSLDDAFGADGPVADDDAPSPGDLRAGLDLFRRLCAPLAWLHGEGLVHGDLKPENVVVGTDGAPVLVDFGLLRTFGDADGRDALEVARGAAGTPLYMSPEQCRGDLPDPRSDLYAFGCMLYELATGRPPFVGTPAALLRAHQEAAVVPPSEHAALPEGLEPLILGLLAKDPARRTGYATDVADALGRLGAVAPEPPVAPRPYLYRAPLAGREPLLDALLPVPAGVTVLAGPAGVGRTRLASEVARRSGRTTLSAEGRRGGVVGQILRQVAARATSAAVFGRYGAALAAYEPAVAALVGPGAAGDARTVAERVVAGTRFSLAALGPVVLVVDDLHLADDLAAELVSALATEASVATVVTVEDAPAGGTPFGGPPARSVRVPPLDDADVDGLACGALAVPALPPEVAGWLRRAAAGNPRFVAESLRLLVDSGRLVRRGGRWLVAGRDGLERLPVPAGMRALAAARLGAVPDRQGLARAALAEDLAVLDGVDVDPLLALGILERDGATVRFAYPALRSVAADGVPEAERPAIHAWCLGRLPDDAPQAVRAVHLTGAGRKVEAAAAWRRAAAAAEARFDWPEVERCARALLALDVSSADAVDVHLRWSCAPALYRRRLDEALAAARRAKALADAGAWPVLALRAAIDEGGVLVEALRFPEAIALLDACAGSAATLGERRLELTARGKLAVAQGDSDDPESAVVGLAGVEAGWEALGDRLETLRSRARRANLLQRCGRAAEALPLLESSGAELVALGDDASAANAFAVAALGRANALELDVARAHVEQALTLVRRAGHLQREGHTLLMASTVHRLRNEDDDALRRLDEAFGLAEELRDPRLLAAARFVRAQWLLDRNDPSAQVAAREAREAQAGLGNVRMAGECALIEAVALERDGAFGAAAAAVDVASAAFVAVGDLAGQLEVARLRGLLALARGEDATPHLREAEAWLERMGGAHTVFVERVAELRARVRS